MPAFAMFRSKASRSNTSAGVDLRYGGAISADGEFMDGGNVSEAGN
jgi:predicted outer membrane repeat protein